MKIAIASDHAGFTLKTQILNLLSGLDHHVEDLGSESADSVDYPDFAEKVASKLSKGEVDRGILICGSGIGMAITACKFKGVRAASIFDSFTCKAARQHNNLNLLCLGSRIVGPALAEEIVRVFLDTPFEGGRHQKRLDKIVQVENKNFTKNIK